MVRLVGITVGFTDGGNVEKNVVVDSLVELNVVGTSVAPLSLPYVGAALGALVGGVTGGVSVGASVLWSSKQYCNSRSSPSSVGQS